MLNPLKYKNWVPQIPPGLDPPGHPGLDFPRAALEARLEARNPSGGEKNAL